MQDIMQTTAGTFALKKISIILDSNSHPAGILAAFPS